MYFVESRKHLRDIFVDLADRQPFMVSGIEGVSAGEFIGYCLHEGLIVEAHAGRGVIHRYTKPELQALCKRFGLPFAGVKAELLERLRHGAADWYREQTELCRFWQLTAVGHQLAFRLAGEIGTERGNLEARLLALLLRREAAEAWRVWTAWNAAETFPISPETTPMLSLGYRPFSEDEFCRVADEAFLVLPTGQAAPFLAALLMGKFLLFEDSELTKRHRQDHAKYLQSLRATPGAIGVRVNVTPHCQCQFAHAYAGEYRLEDAPDLPPSLCSNAPGCSCYLTGIYEREEGSGLSWKKPLCRHQDDDEKAKIDPLPRQDSPPAIIESPNKPDEPEKTQGLWAWVKAIFF